MILEGWMNMKGGRFTADMSDIQTHAKDTKKDVHCPGCRAKLRLSDFKERKDGEGEITNWTKKCDCGAEMTIFNESRKLTFKQFLLSEAKDGPSKSMGNDIIKPHDYSVKLLHQGKGKWPVLHGEIYEKDVLIGTFSRGVVRNGYIPPIESTFRTARAKARFEDFADSLSIAETIEALLPHSALSGSK